MTLKQNFATNLRLLCGRHRSVSEVCRRLAINRQQFNKYLAGPSLPSSATLVRICASHSNLFLTQTLSLVVFYPSYRATLQYLSGVFVSVSSGPGRQPFASRVVYHYLGPTNRPPPGAGVLRPLSDRQRRDRRGD